MSLAVVTPNWLSAAFAQEAKTPWLRDFQQQQRQDFLRRGLPTRREELWKYTDVSVLTKHLFQPAPPHANQSLSDMVQAKRLPSDDSILIVLVNGHFHAELSDLQLLPEHVALCSLQQAFDLHAELIKPLLTVDTRRHPFASLNAALMADGVFLYVPAQTLVAAPIQLLYINSENTDAVANPRNIVIASNGARVTLIEEHCARNPNNYFTNVVTDLHAQAAAQIHYHKIQTEGPKATHIAQIFVHQAQDSNVNIHSLALGAQLAREDVFVNLNAPGASASVNGFYYLNADQQHIDNHIHIDHVAPHGVSHMAYKGILDKKSHAVFNGKIYVHKDAQKTQSHQSNHSLLLSTDAQIDTKPEFEIYADDVKCAHGNTVGQLDQEAVFYLCSRGIAKADALKMLTGAFADDILNKITCGLIRQKMQALLTENHL